MTIFVEYTKTEDTESPTYWRDRYRAWRSCEKPHWIWRKNHARWLEKKALAEKARYEEKE